MTPSIDTITGGQPTVGADGDRHQLAELNDVYLDNTLVLVGCGAAKRDPSDPTDLHQAEIAEGEEWGGTTGPLWRAEDLYTSTYFSVKREFAESVTGWTGEQSTGWGVLSAEHGVVSAWRPLAPYDTTVDDLGDDPTDESCWAEHPYRRPDGQEVVTEMDKWATDTALTLCKWLAANGAGSDALFEGRKRTLLVLAGKSYVEPLRERKVFENGIARVTGDPNRGQEPPIQTRFLFEEIDAGGIGEQMAWLSDAVDTIDEGYDHSRQQEVHDWTGEEQRACDECGATATDELLVERAGTVYCDDCHPRRCSRCDKWTTESGLGNYPLCLDCQTDGGGQKREPLRPDTTEQVGLIDSVAATDGGDEADE